MIDLDPLCSSGVQIPPTCCVVQVSPSQITAQTTSGEVNDSGCWICKDAAGSLGFACPQVSLQSHQAWGCLKHCFVNTVVLRHYCGRNVDATKLNDWSVYLSSAQDKIAFTLLNHHLSSFKCSGQCHSMQRNNTHSAVVQVAASLCTPVWNKHANPDSNGNLSAESRPLQHWPTWWSHTSTQWCCLQRCNHCSP